MTERNDRLLDPAVLPSTLWEENAGALQLPDLLVSAYVDTLDTHGLREFARSRDPRQPPIGGMTQDETDKHFAQALTV